MDSAFSAVIGFWHEMFLYVHFNKFSVYQYLRRVRAKILLRFQRF